MRHLKCFSRETSIKSSFASVKQIAFRKRNLKLETKWVEHLRIIRHLISMRTERGVGLIWGYQFVHLLICPLSHFENIHSSWSAKHKRLFWWTGKAAKEKSKTFDRKHGGEREERNWQPNSLSLKINLPVGSTWCEPRCDVFFQVLCTLAVDQVESIA